MLKLDRVTDEIIRPRVGDVTNKGLLRAYVIYDNLDQAICWTEDLAIVKCKYSELVVDPNSEHLKILYSKKINTNINIMYDQLRKRKTGKSLMAKIKELYNVKFR